MTGYRLVGAGDVSRLAQESRVSAVRRAHLLLHAQQSDPVQRIMIAMQPDTYVRAHRHDRVDESLTILQGELGILIGTEDGRRIETIIRLSRQDASWCCDIRAGTWHAAVALAPDTVILETKAGPYDPTDRTFLPGSPESDTDGARNHVETWRSMFGR